MVQVYLPMGYPLQAGNEFESVIYQGTIARLYTLPTDPRSDSQIQNRRFLSDMSRMRGMMSLWAKAVCKYAIGSKWSTIVYQCAKADVGGWWSDAMNVWDSAEEEIQEEWRTAAPYKATYNDLGMIFFGLVNVLSGAIREYSDLDTIAPSNALEDASLAGQWMAGTWAGAVQGGVFDELNCIIVTSGTWIREAKAGCYGGYYYKPTTSGAHSYRFFYYGRVVDLGVLLHSGGGVAEVYVDDEYLTAYNFYNTVEYFQHRFEVKPRKKGLHKVDVVRNTGLINLDFVQAY